MRDLRKRLRKCTKILLRLAWRKYKRNCAEKSQRQAFWSIDEAHAVLSGWKTEKLIRSVSVKGDIEMFSRDFLSIVERADKEVQQSAARHSIYATRPLSELLWHHPPRTLVDAAQCVQRLAAEVPRLQNQAAALAHTGGTWTPEAAAVLKEVIEGVPQTMRKERGSQGEVGMLSARTRVRWSDGEHVRACRCSMSTTCWTRCCRLRTTRTSRGSAA